MQDSDEEITKSQVFPKNLSKSTKNSDDNLAKHFVLKRNRMKIESKPKILIKKEEEKKSDVSINELKKQNSAKIESPFKAIKGLKSIKSILTNMQKKKSTGDILMKGRINISPLNKRKPRNIFKSLVMNSLTQYLSNPFFDQFRNNYLTYGDQVSTQILKSGEIGSYSPLQYIYEEQPKETDLIIILHGEVTLLDLDNHLEHKNRESFLTKDYLYAQCFSECIICEINYRKYNLIIEKYKSLEKISEVNFLSELSLFHASNRVLLEKIYSKIKRINNKKGDIISVQNEGFEGMYIIRKGQYKLTWEFNENIYREIDTVALDNLAQCAPERFSSQRKYELINSYKNKKIFNVIIMSAGDYINDIEIYNKTQKCYFSVVCSVDNSIIYLIPKEIIVQSFYENEDLMNEMMKIVNSKEKMFLERINFCVRKSRQFSFNENKFSQIVIRKINKSPQWDKVERKKESKHNVSFKKLKVSSSKKSPNDTFYKTKYEEDIAFSLRNFKSSFLRKSAKINNNELNNSQNLKSNKVFKVKGIEMSENLSRCFQLNKQLYIKNSSFAIEKKMSNLYLNKSTSSISRSSKNIRSKFMIYSYSKDSK